jgi:hypothetical protein
VAGTCEHENQPSGYIKGRELLDSLSDDQLLKTEHIPWGYLFNHNTTLLQLSLENKFQTYSHYL